PRAPAGRTPLVHRARGRLPRPGDVSPDLLRAHGAPRWRAGRARPRLGPRSGRGVLPGCGDVLRPRTGRSEAATGGDPGVLGIRPDGGRLRARSRLARRASSLDCARLARPGDRRRVRAQGARAPRRRWARGRVPRGSGRAHDLTRRAGPGDHGALVGAGLLERRVADAGLVNPGVWRSRRSWPQHRAEVEHLVGERSERAAEERAEEPDPTVRPLVLDEHRPEGTTRV